MKQLSKRTLALLLVIYIVSLGININAKYDLPSSYIVYEPVDATIELYFNVEPNFYQDISDIQWYRGYTYTGLDLDNYFNDTVGETLTYSFSGPVNIAVAFNDSIVTFVTVISGWTGSEQIIFTATDNYSATKNSNNVTLTVVTPPSGSSGGSSGGGGGGGGGGTSYQSTACIEQWACTDWSECSKTGTVGKQKRTCIDINDCKIKESQPAEKRDCTIPVVAVAEVEDIPIFAPLIREVSHRPVLWVVMVLIAVFMIEAYVYWHQWKTHRESRKKYYG